jgi:hypothetical protein
MPDPPSFHNAQSANETVPFAYRFIPLGKRRTACCAGQQGGDTLHLSEVPQDLEADSLRAAFGIPPPPQADKHIGREWIDPPHVYPEWTRTSSSPGKSQPGE